MHAEGSTGAGESLRFRRLEIDLFMHLRSAGRGPELEQLTVSVQRAFGPRLEAVGAYAELTGEPETGSVCALRTRPSEIVIWSIRDAAAAPAPAAATARENGLAVAGSSRLLHAVDATHGQAAFLIAGAAARSLLQRLADETSLPRTPGSATRLRLADLHATLAWRRDGNFVALVDVHYADFLSERVAYAATFNGRDG